MRDFQKVLKQVDELNIYQLIKDDISKIIDMHKKLMDEPYQKEAFNKLSDEIFDLKLGIAKKAVEYMEAKTKK